MRPGQNNKRMRGRPNGRKGPNPLTRSYESSGPDVKIRGTAQHIGEKYLQLARDAQTSGDPVMAESYLQHAEHYFRLIAGAQQQGPAGYPAQPADLNADEPEEELDAGGALDRFASPLERLAPPPQPNYLPQAQPNAPQPLPERSSHGNWDRQGYARPEHGPRPERSLQDRNFRERDFQPPAERPYQEPRAFQERNGRGRDQEGQSNHGRGPRNYRNENLFRNDQRSDAQMAEAGIEGGALPAFITGPVRVAAEAHEAAASGEPRPPLRAVPPGMEAAAGGFPPRPRRRRGSKEEPEAARTRSGAEESASDPVQD